jgi:leader peptidase (prepilin peptidase)/N-methyltransferase
MLVVVCALVGLVVGAALNPLIVRAPDRALPLIAGPVLVAPTTTRQRVVCATTAVVFAALAGRFGAHWPLVTYLVGAASMVAVSFVDLDTMRIPDRLTAPTVVAVTLLVVAVSLGVGEPDAMLRALIGALAFSGVLGVFWFVYPAGMGFGDVKYAVVLGALSGWISPLLVAYALLVASLLGSLAGVLVAVRAGDRKQAFPFGPALCIGTIVAIVFSHRLLP